MIKDDSCPRCGHLSGDGLMHLTCPVECGDCGYLGFPTLRDKCPNCWAIKMWEEMNGDQRECFRWIIEDESDVLHDD